MCLFRPFLRGASFVGWLVAFLGGSASFVYAMPASASASASVSRRETFAQIKQRTLIIGTKLAPPFAIKEADGSWSGISIELWDKIAREHQIRYRFRELSLKELLEQVQTGQIDAVVASLTITQEREARFDFSHPFYNTGLAIAVPTGRSSSLMSALKKIISWDFLSFFLALFFVLFLAGTVVWWFERKHNHDQFGGSVIEGIGSGIWWSAVTMTTVGYGDKAPRTVLGRVVAMIWIFTRYERESQRIDPLDESE